MRLLALLRAPILALIVFVLGFATTAFASPITYAISGVASGNIGGTPFSNVLVTVTSTGDTAGVTTIFGGPLVALALGTTTVTIPGVGTATITDPTEIFASVIPVPIDTGYPVLPYVIIGKMDAPPALDSFTGIGGVGSNALLGYDLTTPFGPLVASPGGVGYIVPCGVPGSDPCLHTTLGLLSFTANISPTGQGTFVAATPEPASLILLGSGVAMLVRRRSRARG